MNERYVSRLRYLDADDVDDSVVDFDGLDVRGRDNEKLGDIDGFIVDSSSGRVYYAVVDSGGWFASRKFLLPVGHATIDRDRSALCVDLTRDALRRYPEFDERLFAGFSDDELRAYEARMEDVCCADEARTSAASSPTAWAFDSRRHYRQPDWWNGGFVRERLRAIEAPGTRVEPALVRERSDREHVVARGDDVSPHFEGRAQPGDVLGLETGGERTYMGDTVEDENKRRRIAERTVEKDDRQSER